MKPYRIAYQYRAARVQRQAAFYGRLYHLGGLLASARNMVLRKRSPDRLLDSFDWLYAPPQPPG